MYFFHIQSFIDNLLPICATRIHIQKPKRKKKFLPFQSFGVSFSERIQCIGILKRNDKKMNRCTISILSILFFITSLNLTGKLPDIIISPNKIFPQSSISQRGYERAQAIFNSIKLSRLHPTYNYHYHNKQTNKHVQNNYSTNTPQYSPLPLEAVKQIFLTTNIETIYKNGIYDISPEFIHKIETFAKNHPGKLKSEIAIRIQNADYKFWHSGGASKERKIAGKEKSFWLDMQRENSIPTKPGTSDPKPKIIQTVNTEYHSNLQELQRWYHDSYTTEENPEFVHALNETINNPGILYNSTTNLSHSAKDTLQTLNIDTTKYDNFRGDSFQKYIADNTLEKINLSSEIRSHFLEKDETIVKACDASIYLADASFEAAVAKKPQEAILASTLSESTLGYAFAKAGKVAWGAAKGISKGLLSKITAPYEMWKEGDYLGLVSCIPGPIGTTIGLGRFLHTVGYSLATTEGRTGLSQAYENFLNMPLEEQVESITTLLASSVGPGKLLAGSKLGTGISKIGNLVKSELSSITKWANGTKQCSQTLTMLKGWINEGKRIENRIEYLIDDKTKILFRRDFGNKAHSVEPLGYYKPVNHYNIDFHIKNKRGRWDPYKRNIHIIIDKNGNVEKVG